MSVGGYLDLQRVGLATVCRSRGTRLQIDSSIATKIYLLSYIKSKYESTPMKLLQSVKVKEYYKIFSELTKFKLSILNGLVATGAFCFYSTTLSCLPLFGSSVFLSMSSQIFNQYIQVEYDRKMVRTCQRPLVRGFSSKIALFSGAALGVTGVVGLYCYNPITALLGVSIWIGYLFVYTAMKRKSTFNTFVGSIVGSLPVYLGWTAAGHSICLVEPFGMFMYMMAWQHQHFYGIRWNYFEDYNKAGFKMEKSKDVAAAQVIPLTLISTALISAALRHCCPQYCFLMSVPIFVGLSYWGIKASLLFAEGKMTSQEYKKQSYFHFTLVMAIFILCSLIGRNQIHANEMKNRLMASADEQNLFYAYL